MLSAWPSLTLVCLSRRPLVLNGASAPTGLVAGFFDRRLRAVPLESDTVLDWGGFPGAFQSIRADPSNPSLFVVAAGEEVWLECTANCSLHDMVSLLFISIWLGLHVRQPPSSACPAIYWRRIHQNDGSVLGRLRLAFYRCWQRRFGNFFVRGDALAFPQTNTCTFGTVGWDLCYPASLAIVHLYILWTGTPQITLLLFLEAKTKPCACGVHSLARLRSAVNTMSRRGEY